MDKDLFDVGADPSSMSDLLYFLILTRVVDV